MRVAINHAENLGTLTQSGPPAELLLDSPENQKRSLFSRNVAYGVQVAILKYEMFFRNDVSGVSLYKFTRVHCCEIQH